MENVLQKINDFLKEDHTYNEYMKFLREIKSELNELVEKEDK